MPEISPALVRETGSVVAGPLSPATFLGLDEEETPELRWPLSTYVYDRMRRQDAQVGSVLRAVTLPVRRTAWRLDPNGARDEVVATISEDLGLPIVGQPESEFQMPRSRGRFSWREHLRLALLMLPLGHSVFEQVYRVEGSGPSARARLRKLAQRPSRTILGWDVARDGGLVAVKQWGERAEVSIPVDRLVVYCNEREGGNWQGTSLLRTCYKNWLLKDRLLRVQAQSIDRNGMGIPLYEAAESETSTDAGLAIAQSWRAGDASGAAIPHGARLRLVGVEGAIPDADTPIRYHDEQIGRSVLAHFLNLGQQTGSWALGSTFADFFTASLQAVADDIADTATQHIVEDLVDLNWGEDEAAPRIVPDEIGAQQAATAQAIKLLVDAGVIRNDRDLEEAIRQQYGLPPKGTTPPASTTPPDSTGGNPA